MARRTGHLTLMFLSPQFNDVLRRSQLDRHIEVINGRSMEINSPLEGSSSVQ
ncbi:hypothetical protein HI853_03165 [Cyanobacteria bacterium 150SLHA]|uniref:hypothetical protein n=1 Tax=Prochlorococcus TaxID=1218 RepID=UPI00145FAA48|nr:MULTISPECIES: hypothetical protein [Prochlorococcus]NMP12869.1 hypothetical protein [Prochlorococcus sp.P1363]